MKTKPDYVKARVKKEKKSILRTIYEKIANGRKMKTQKGCP